MNKISEKKESLVLKIFLLICSFSIIGYGLFCLFFNISRLHHSSLIAILVIIGALIFSCGVLVFVGTIFRSVKKVHFFLIAAGSVLAYVNIFTSILAAVGFSYAKGFLFTIVSTIDGYNEMNDIARSALCGGEDVKTFHCLESIVLFVEKYTHFVPLFASLGAIFLTGLLIILFFYEGREYFSAFVLNFISITVIIFGLLMLITGVIFISHSTIRKAFVLYYAFLILIIFGVLLLALSFVGFFSFFVKSGRLLIIFIVFNIFVFIALIVIGILSVTLSPAIAKKAVDDPVSRRTIISEFDVVQEWNAADADMEEDEKKLVRSMVLGLLDFVSGVVFAFSGFEVVTIIGAAVKLKLRVEEEGAIKVMRRLNERRTKQPPTVPYESLLYGDEESDDGEGKGFVEKGVGIQEDEGFITD